MKRCIAFMNEKGGTGKTTLAIHAAAYFASQGLRTVLIDMDPQGCAGKCLKVTPSPGEPSILDALVEKSMPLINILKKTPRENLWLAPSDSRLADFTINVVQDENRQFRLARALEALGYFDAILIDAPPSLCLASINILVASKEVVIPVPPTFLGMNGCIQTIKSFLRLRESQPENCPVLRSVVPVMVNGSKSQKRILSSLQKRFSRKLSEALVPFDHLVDLAQLNGKTVYDTDPKGDVSVTLQEFSKELMQRLTP